jgi:hypothetical protein
MACARVGECSIDPMRPLRCIAAGAALWALSATPSPAVAAPVLELDHGHVSVHQDRFLPAYAPPYASGRRRPAAQTAQSRTFRSELTRLHDEGRVDDTTFELARGILDEAEAAAARLTGTRRAELRGAIANLDAVAARGMLTASRVSPLATILDRNTEWWTTGSLLSDGARVTFKGSRVIYQYFRGEGIQFHPLANFGRASALAADPRYLTNADAFLTELRDFAVPRPGGGLTWEYSFDFDGGRPPWTSGLAQGAAIQAYSRVATALDKPEWADVARAGLRLYELPPPEGVRIRTAAGAHYLIYSFAPRMRVINAFSEAVLGLYDTATLLGDARAQALFAAGDAEARLELPSYDTGAWSLYDGVTESNLSYHELLTGFLADLCQRLPGTIYCGKAARFKAYETQKPRIRLLTRRLAVGRAQFLRISLSKVSSASVTGRRAGAVVYTWSGQLGHGTRLLGIRPRKAGRISFTLSARDLNGNRGTATGSVAVPGT